jgi:hypothetical protein
MDGMDAGNPYAATKAPLADGLPAAEREAKEADALPPWRLEGRTLIARNGTTLPDVCLFTGEATAAGQRVSLPLGWTPIWFRVGLFIAPMFAAFAYGAFRRTATIEAGLSEAGRKRRRLVSLLILAASAGGIGSLVAVASEGAEGLPLAGLLALATLALIPVVLAVRIYRVTLIDGKFTHIRLRPRVAAAFARLPPPAAPAG